MPNYVVYVLIMLQLVDIFIEIEFSNTIFELRT